MVGGHAVPGAIGTGGLAKSLEGHGKTVLLAACRPSSRRRIAISVGSGRYQGAFTYALAQVLGRGGRTRWRA